jgi:hypothetical protein
LIIGLDTRFLGQKRKKKMQRGKQIASDDDMKGKTKADPLRGGQQKSKSKNNSNRKRRGSWLRSE